MNQTSPLTIKNYIYVFKKTKDIFQEMKLEDERTINESHIIKLLSCLKKQKTANWFYVKLINYLKVYFRYLEKNNIIFINPMENIQAPKEVKRKSKALNKEELLNDLSKIKTQTDMDIRGKAILELLYSTAIRPFELRNIKVNDLNFYRKELFIEKGKNKKDRVVPVGKTALFWIEKYLSHVRPKHLKDKYYPYLFITLKGTSKMLSRRGLHDAIKYIFDKNKIQRFKPYALRTSCATHCLLNGMDILHIQKLLGHSAITTTKAYLQVDTLDLKNVLSKSHPRNKF